jgi:hypothetical protein
MLFTRIAPLVFLATLADPPPVGAQLQAMVIPAELRRKPQFQ